MRRPSMLIVNPRADSAPYFGAEVCTKIRGERVAFIADLASATLASFASPYFDVCVADEQTEEIDLAIDVDIVAITAKNSQLASAQRIARSFAERGKLIVIGGPHASLAPEELREFCDVIEYVGRWLSAELGDAMPSSQRRTQASFLRAF